MSSLSEITICLINLDDSVEVAITFLKECGQKLTEVSPRGITAIFDRLRNVLHEADLDKRTQYMIEVMFQVKRVPIKVMFIRHLRQILNIFLTFKVRKDGFKDNPSVLPELDLVEEDDQITHMMMLEDATNK